MASGSPSIESLIDEYYAGLYRYAYRLSGTSSDAEDLTQETFRKALARLDQLRDQERAKGWLFRILRNAYLHRIRGEKRSRIVPMENVDDVPGRDDQSPASIDPDELQKVLNELDESFRTPVILFYFEEFSYKDIAEQLDMPIGTVMSRLARAKGYLRGKLAKFQDQYQ